MLIQIKVPNLMPFARLKIGAITPRYTKLQANIFPLIVIKLQEAWFAKIDEE